jgi:hypothetical protein
MVKTLRFGAALRTRVANALAYVAITLMYWSLYVRPKSVVLVVAPEPLQLEAESQRTRNQRLN